MKCPLCDTMPRTKSAFLQHVWGHKDEFRKRKDIHGSVLCPMQGCNYSHRNRSRLRIHLRSHLEGFKPKGCPICHDRLDLKDDSLEHVWGHRHEFAKTSGQPALVSCPMVGCEYSHKELGALKGHLRKHVKGAELFLHKCPRCRLSFKNLSEIINHLVSSHRAVFKEIPGHPPGILGCPMSGCSYSCPERTQLEAHLRWHHHKRFCIYCGEYIDASSFNEHISVKHK